MDSKTIASSPSEFLVTCEVDGRDLGTFDKMEGGHTVAQARKYREGGRLHEAVGGTPPTTSDVVITRVFKRDRDASLVPWLNQRAGWASGRAAKQPLDARRTPSGNPLVASDLVFLGCESPDPDADDTQGTGMLKLTFAVGAPLA